ncbi:GNAT family N-acetyltransferase, partial [Serratia bockelmannii]|nr:GNAT family N-acetyltransferase [Serratia bockelmannii]
MDSLITFEKLTAQHLPYLYEIRFSVEENLLHPHKVQYLQRNQALEDINQCAGWNSKYGDD